LTQARPSAVNENSGVLVHISIT